MNDEKLFETIVVSTVNLYRTHKTTDPKLTESIIDLLIDTDIPVDDFTELKENLNRVWLFSDRRVMKWEQRECLLLAFDSLNDYRVGDEVVKISQRIDKRRSRETP